jgi:endonuclease YncB( thermonuclease family)
MWLGRLILITSLLYFNPVFSQFKLNEQLHLNLKNQTFVAKVIGISDGDTMEILYQNTPIKIRLAHIDCPEKRGSQPYGNNAKKSLSDLCFGQQVKVYGQKYDRYRRLIAVVKTNSNIIVNQEMIKQGMAWHFKKYSKDETYANLEIDARKHKIGLWRDPSPIPPWEWRKSKHKKPILKISQSS